MTLVVEHLSRNKALLVVDCCVVLSHVLDDAGLGRHLTLDCTSLGQECLDLGTVFLHVIVVDVTLSIYIEDWRLMKIAYKTKCSALDF
jgi:hypothetical protein